jgi:N-acetyl-1-D-myo-inositol-2-amino-2-deoxy-alpha-D-glucopyranoside deacetylase
MIEAIEMNRIEGLTSRVGGPFGGPVLFSLAHPDDESFSAAGTIARATARGAHVTVLSATRGERGESAITGVDSPETLAAVREQELRTAMALLGVSDVRFLDYWDSGMDGTPTNSHPRAFAQADRAEIVTRLAVHIRGLQPAIVVTFGADGGYGHPDHIAIHFATVEAIRLAAEPDYRPVLGEPWRVGALYFTAAPRELLLEYAARNEGPFRHLSEEARQRIGTPDAEITTRIHVESLLPRKAAAILAHRSQVPDPSRFSTDSASESTHWRMLRHEHYVRAALPWEDPDVELPDPLLILNPPDESTEHAK